MSSPLYYAPDGSSRFSGSYSSLSDYQSCPKKFFYKRVQGWMPKEKRASFQYGIAVEASITYFHKNGCVKGSSVKEFSEVAWPQFKNADLTYTEAEGSWEDLLRMGSEVLALYEVYYETERFPFKGYSPIFQYNSRTKLWPDDDKYGKLTTNAYLDMLLPDLIVDIKTAGKMYPESPKNWPAKDKQLLTYAFETGIRNVAFLVLVKVRAGIRKGDEVSFLSDNGEYKAGDKAIVIRASGPNAWIVKDSEAFEAFEKESDGLKGKALDEVVAKHGTIFPLSVVTKQKIQFIEGKVSDDDLRYMREEIEETMLDIVRCTELGEFRPNYGVRFPSSWCLMCDFNGLCFDDKQLVEEKLVKIDLDWLDEKADE